MTTSIPIINLLDCLYGKQLSELEEASLKLNRLYNIDDSEGDELDVIGGLIGQPRFGWPDNMYRLFIKARAVANSSTGTTNEVLTALEILTDSSSYIQVYTMAIDVCGNITAELAPYIRQFMEDVVDAGVEILTVQYSVPGLFGFSDETGTINSDDCGTFGDETDNSIGGNFSDILN